MDNFSYLHLPVVGCGMFPKRYSHSNIWSLWIYPCIEKKGGGDVFTDMTKELRILRWGDYPMSSKCYHMYAYKREAEGNLILKRETWRFCPWRLELWSPKSSNTDIPKLEETKNWFSPRVAGRSMDLPTPWFQLSDTELWLLSFRIVRE